MSRIESVEVPVSSTALTESRTIIRAWTPRLIPLALALVTFLVFMPALWNQFVEWDDQVNLYENPDYRGLTWPQIRWMFSTLLMGHWIPLTWLTFGFDYVLWGMDPFGYHLTSLVVFAANAAVLYLVALRLLRLATGFVEGTLRFSAIVATLFFTIHPLRAESVGWATERRDVLSGLFYLLTALLYLKAQDGGSRRRWMLAGSVGMFALALVSKASVMVLPAVLVLLDVYPLRRLGGGWHGWTGRAARAVWLEKIPFVVLGLAGAIITYHAQKVNLFITPLEKYPLSARPAMVFYSLWFYLAKTVMPQGLSPLYELPEKVHLFDRQFLVPAIAVTAITATVLALWRRWPAGLAVWAYYAIALGPVIGIVHSGHQLTNDRYSYLPALGLSLLLGAAAGAAVQAASAGMFRPALAKALAALGVVWFCGLAYLSAHQVQIWRDTETLWRNSLESDPTCSICHGNLGVYFSNRGLLDLAKTEFEHVQALRPDNVKVHQHLGYTYAMLGDYERALGHFEIFFARNPNDVEGLNNYSAALLNGGRPAEAIAHLERAITIKPGHVLSYVNLGFAHADLGRRSEALATFRKAVALQYDSPQAWFGLSRVYYESGNVQAAHTAWGILGQIDKKFANRMGPAFLQTW
jgi:tetratricopeptide (TPR) repeat protein